MCETQTAAGKDGIHVLAGGGCIIRRNLFFVFLSTSAKNKVLHSL